MFKKKRFFQFVFFLNISLSWKIEGQSKKEDEHVVGNICLLCKRQFNSAETLRKHVEMSQLHKTNLELAQAKQEEKNKEKEREALERRNIKKRKIETIQAPVVVESGTDLNEKNVGHQLLEKMGWKKGDTIGASQATVTAPIQVSFKIINLHFF